MRWSPAEFHQPAGADVLCTLCPHGCRLADGAIGACRVRRRRGEGLETATFASATWHLDAIERKPFYHFLPGTRALTLAAPGCSFACDYCQNYRISQVGRLPELPWSAEPVEPEEVAAAAAAQGAAIALSYSEPVLAAEMTLALAAAARPRGVPIVWKTNGFVTLDALARIAPCLSAVNVDLKAPDEARHRALTGAPLAPVLAALAALVRAGVWVEVSTPLLPGVNDDPASLRLMAQMVARSGETIPWHLLRFTPEFRMRGEQPTSPQALGDAVAIAREAGLPYVYVERALGPEGRATRCPRCGEEVVARGIWCTLRTSLGAGLCPGCGESIPGRWRSSPWQSTASSSTFPT
jgi:pyruvate formate lyase activating enzyme